ncbi:MAG: hypothetical protein WCO56_27160 [Verrucomicrobiota bacterium]
MRDSNPPLGWAAAGGACNNSERIASPQARVGCGGEGGRTATKKWRAGIQRLADWVKTHRHLKLDRMLGTLRAKLRGTWNYYGVIGNHRRLRSFYDATCRVLYKWLNRRSQRPSLTWPALYRLLARFHIQRPYIVEKNQQRMPWQGELSFCQRLWPCPPWLRPPKTHASAS